MEPLVINIGWEYFLSIMGVMIVVPLAVMVFFDKKLEKFDSKFDKIKDEISRIDRALGALKGVVEILKSNVNTLLNNKVVESFARNSPINLSVLGKKQLEESGLKEYLNKHQEKILKECKTKKESNDYEIQEYIFNFFDTYRFETNFENDLEQYSYDNGITMWTLRRVAAVHWRNFILDKYEKTKY